MAQDALVRAYKAYSTGGYVESVATPWPWLLRILTNLFINDYNRRRKWEAGLAQKTASGAFAPPQAGQTRGAAGGAPRVFGSVLFASTLYPPLRLCCTIASTSSPGIEGPCPSRLRQT